MKKSIALLLSATMLIGSSMALTGCKAEFTEDGGIKITEDKKVEDTNTATEVTTETKTDEGNTVGTATETTTPAEETKTADDTKSNSVAPTATKTATGASTLNVNETVTIGDVMELTLESAAWTEEIEPSNTSASYYSTIDDKEGEKFFVVRGKVKNLAGGDLDLSWKGFKGEMLINDTYKSDLSIEVEKSDGTGFYADIKPLQTLNVIIYASISDELQGMAESASVNLKFVNDAEYIDEYFYEDKVPYNEYNILFK
ncbi:MAG: hypothetical protein E7413_02210 [Ruminococcaceae bacterium]|nr:hypothetical protein [Oscillospiraceae bacterium]